MTIAIYNMQSKHTKMQSIMWKKLNTMFKHEFPKSNFKGFMVDNM